MDFSLQVSGVQAVQSALVAAMERRKALAAAAIAKAAFDCQAQAQDNAPVDTGFLEGSIHVEQDGEAAYRVVVGAKYGIYQELGTHKMKAHPFLFPAYVRANKALAEVLKRIGQL